MTLEQPAAPRSQQTLRLASQWAFADSRDGRERCLLAFPLPGAEDGPRDFLIYFTQPDRDGELNIDPAEDEAVRGFLIQAVGHMRGRTQFAEGTMRRRRLAFSNTRRVDVDVRCADGTRIVGTAYAQPSAYELQAFESKYSADVALLNADAGPSAASRPAGYTDGPPDAQPPTDTGGGAK